MYRKLVLIISTDFFCWVPFILVSALHYYSIVDASPWYATFSIVILPINSVINPILYDSYLGALLKRLWFLSKRLQRFVSGYESSSANPLGATPRKITQAPQLRHGPIEVRVVPGPETEIITARVKERKNGVTISPSPSQLPTAERHALRMRRRRDRVINEDQEIELAP